MAIINPLVVRNMRQASPEGTTDPLADDSLWPTISISTAQANDGDEGTFCGFGYWKIFSASTEFLLGMSCTFPTLSEITVSDKLRLGGRLSQQTGVSFADLAFAIYPYDSETGIDTSVKLVTTPTQAPFLFYDVTLTQAFIDALFSPASDEWRIRVILDRSTPFALGVNYGWISWGEVEADLFNAAGPVTHLLEGELLATAEGAVDGFPVSRALSATALAEAVSSADLSISKTLSATVLGQAEASADLERDVSLSSSVEARAFVSALLEEDNALAGKITGQAFTEAALSVDKTLSGDALASATTDADLTVDVALTSGLTIAEAFTDADLEGFGAVLIDGVEIVSLIDDEALLLVSDGEEYRIL